MSNNIIPSIETLPLELLHRIFDNFNTETILFSILPVSRLFESSVNTYNRYDLNFHLISKSVFHVLCRLINPENVISLTLSNDYRTSNQIDLFISLFDLKQFTRLRSLTLLDINESQLNHILKHINLNTLTLFSFQVKEYDDGCIGTTTSHLLSPVISQPTLRRLEFGIRNDKVLNILWPTNCTIQHLTINDFIKLDDLCKILQYFPYLNTLIMKHVLMGEIKSFPSISFQQISSLTINQYHEKIDELESLLLLTPSLLHLKLIGGQEMPDGKRWEEFIHRNLSQLDKFEFYSTKLMKS
ncbi:unnamed protein product, partial [Rotaria sp. Silwood2]